MRTTIVPAQITTVEDRIAGNLTMTQIFLLLVPIFFGSIIYCIFPPQLHIALYKLPLMLVITGIFATLAIRFKGRIILQWIVILLRYNTRPRFYVADKNDAYGRDIIQEVQRTQEAEEEIAIIQEQDDTEIVAEISIKDRVKLEHVLMHPKANLRFLFAKKGGMNVSLSEIK